MKKNINTKRLLIQEVKKAKIKNNINNFLTDCLSKFIEIV